MGIFAISSFNVQRYAEASSLPAEKIFAPVRVAIVVTDGYSNSFSQTVSAASALHAAGIIGFAIGISGANTNELNAIASQPSYVAFISSFNSALLANLQQTISNEACTGKNVSSLQLLFSVHLFNILLQHLQNLKSLRWFLAW